MPEWVRTLLKWTAALVAMGLVVVLAVPRVFDELSQAVSFDMNGGAVAPGTTPTPEEPEELPTISGETSVAAVASIGGDVVVALNPGTVTLGPDDADDLLLGFEALPTDPACVTEVNLEIPMHDAPGLPEMLVRPATVVDFSALAEGDPLPGGTILETDDAARGTPGEGADYLRWTVTSPHAVATREAEADSLIVLSVTLVPDAEGSVSMGTATGEEAGPFLAWTAVEDCPDASPDA